MNTYSASELTTPSRYPERASYEREAIHDLLDSQMMCHVGFVVDGAPRVLPTLLVRVGDTIYLHGSTAATWLLKARHDGGLPVVVSVAAIDALVLARSQPHHSVNYRSVVAHGVAKLVTDVEAKRAAMAALVDKVGPERSAHTRPPTAAEMAQIAVLALDLDQVSLKQRTGGPVDDEEDLTLPYWAGVVPLTTAKGFGEPAAGVSVEPPPYVPARSGWYASPELTGTYVTLEPLHVDHAKDLFAALDDQEVWEHTPSPRPASVDDMADILRTRLDDPDRATWVQRHLATGQIVGITSYYDISEVHQHLAIGYTQIGKPWWRTAVNTEAKLLLLTHAFETLGAQRVVWHTDIRNLRSRAAIERLGAKQDGVFRRHKRRSDGSWRDTVQFAMTVEDWPEARDRLVRRLAQGSD
jgi:RimJ/RimL family protein N-acetyltransferase/nitroimidazol reductase NimA-like FMN-containing flavoprotein (pyridoxamine 5'-phosphate oxidase superfamily)